MSIIEKVKAESIKLRKAKDPLAAFSTFVISEIVNVGKKSNRETTDDEAIAVLKKIVSVIDANLVQTVNDDALKAEKRFVEALLPEMASDDQIREAFATLDKPINKGIAMKALKAKFGSLVDMKRAGEILAEYTVA